MKIRNGFVSNSSSSSFVIVGSKGAFDKAMVEFRKGNLPNLREDLDEDEIESIERYGNEYAAELEGMAINIPLGDLDIVAIVSLDIWDGTDRYAALGELAQYCYGRTDLLAIQGG